MPSEQSVQVPLVGWSPVSGEPFAWTDESGDTLSIHHFPIPPDLAGSLSDLTAIRRQYRKLLGRRGGIVELESESVAGFAALRSLLKMLQEPSRMSYLAAFTFPFRDCSFVVKVGCRESGMTGLRDTAVALKLGMTSRGWSRDPYAPGYRNPVLRNRSDDPEWDALFPKHPLSRARVHLATLRGLSLSSDVGDLAPFEGPIRPSGFLRRLLFQG